MGGTVNISRRLWSDTAFKDEPFTEREAFVWIIMEASWRAREKRVGNIVVNLERGQLATSVRFMCEAWKWSKSRVDRFLKRLENRDMIGTDSGTGINVITVMKYDTYQNTPGHIGTAVSEKRDSSGTAAGQQRDKPNKGLIPDAIKEDPQTPKGVDADDVKETPVSILATVASQRVAEEFVAFRREDKKRPVSVRAAKAMVKKLEGHRDPDSVLMNSIANDWQGIFPEKTPVESKGAYQPRAGYTSAGAFGNIRQHN